MYETTTQENLPIGIFDSGVGGLTVLHALKNLLPAENLLYLGDTARLPYGTKSHDSVTRYALQAADYLVQRGIKLLVVACNTASALALESLREHLAPLPVIGVVEPGAIAAVECSKSQHLLVLATEATTSQLAYTRAILRLNPDAVIEEMPCSLFVALAEEGWHQGPVADVVAEQYLGLIRERSADLRPDTAILGCTHFPLLQGPIAQALGPDIKIVDSATTTAQAVQEELVRLSLLTDADGGGDLQLIATDGPERFARVGSAFLGEKFAAEDIKLIDIHPTDLAVSG
ncbi:MAG: glutamate racemase [Gammaproteobacteria bacterium]|nr:glutamate racemase [Gammaproteobacteria bacterium]MCP4088811.1 glutamate racemase [Gammaproteobacteria bacterium]MCP4275890.1 glutamate racemase [Gammaproteobacteria bacterium]MCP4832106.1 glutamate racemase [Gammaproteobacteria bacterium]MCP4928293.1 glutamate racemase [Gammaproteobacteria bacterium]